MMATRTCVRCARGEEHSFRHGSLHSFAYHGCRCGECLRGARAACRKWRSNNPEKRQLGAHGTARDRHEYYVRNRESYRAHHADQLAKFARAVGNPQRRRWTANEDVIAMRADISILEIAYLLGRNRGSILYRRGVLAGAGGNK